MKDGACVFGDEIAALSQTMMRRQGAYIAAWWVSLAASLIFLLEFVRQAVHIVF